MASEGDWFKYGFSSYTTSYLCTHYRPVEHGPSVLFMTITMMVMLGSSFFTDIIGVHPIFGTVSYYYLWPKYL